MNAGEFYDDLETRDEEKRQAQHLDSLRRQLARAKAKTGFFGKLLAEVSPQEIGSLDSLASLPVTRKSDIARSQEADPPFGDLTAGESVTHIFMSPGSIFEPGTDGRDFGRFARALWAAGMRPDDIVHNTFSYHLTPAGAMFESGARAIGCIVFPGGVGNTELQVQAIGRIRPQGYVGTPSFLRILLEKGDELGIDTSSIAKAVVGAEALTPTMRDLFAARDIAAANSYATADTGLIAYESKARDGMIVDEGLVLELVEPGGTAPVAEGEVGEVVVTTFDPAYPLIRYGTGDLSQHLPGASPCGRTNRRIRGWMGRADHSVKFRGMFVHPSGVMDVVRRHSEIGSARLVVENPGDVDRMTLRVVATDADPELKAAIERSMQAVLKLRGEVAFVAELPDDGRVVEDLRKL